MRTRIWATVAGVLLGVGGLAAPAVAGTTPGDGGEFCAAFEAFLAAGETMGIDDELTVLDAAQQEQLYTALDAMDEALDEIEAAAPADLSDAVAQLARFVRDVDGLLRGADLGDAAAVDELNAELGALEDQASIDDPDESAVLALLDYWSETCLDEGSFGMPACLLTADTVATVSGTEIVDDINTFGGMTLGTMSFSVEISADSIVDTSETPATLGWSGCSYEAADGTELMVGELVDAEGAPDPAQFDQLATVDPATDADDPPVPVEDVGDAAYRYGGRLFVLAGDHAIVVEAAEPLDVELATAAIDALAAPAASMP